MLSFFNGKIVVACEWGVFILDGEEFVLIRFSEEVEA